MGARVGGVCWARGHARGAEVAAGMMLLSLGFAVLPIIQLPIVQRPQQRIEEACEKG
jgi:hypothetical protein